jgi:leucyl aminopeptidase
MASSVAPHLLKIEWQSNADEDLPVICLVGKGVCFDSGGLQVKPGNSMDIMKKDMGGAAHVLALAERMIRANLPVRLTVFLPLVENAIAGNAFRPRDVLTSRKGLTVEVGHTDAEGRLILCDCLFEGSRNKPDVIIDMATLTGAARVALGLDIPVYFSNNDGLARDLEGAAREESDPLWRLPLVESYDVKMNSKVADVHSTGGDSYGGAIHAALFLQRFVESDVPWLHFDLSAWNDRARPGRPDGGEAFALRALYRMIENRFCQSDALAID